MKQKQFTFSSWMTFLHILTRVGLGAQEGYTVGQAVDHKGACYTAVDGVSYTYDQARAACEASGMRLASIRAPDQESFVETHVLRFAPSRKLWLGAARSAEAQGRTSWQWVDGQRFIWEDFGEGQGEVVGGKSD